MEYEPIGNQMMVAVSKSHRFGTDSILLAHFSAPRENSRVCDLGTGCGILPLYWFGRMDKLLVTGVELQKEACELARNGAQKSGVADRYHVLQEDIKHIRKLMDHASFDLVTCNPPYFADAGKMVSPSQSAAVSRHETACRFEDIAAAAAYLLPFSGRFCFCHRPQRLADLLETVRQNGMEPKRLRLVQNSLDKAPFLALIECVKGGGVQMDVMPALILRDQTGNETPETCEIYGGKA